MGKPSAPSPPDPQATAAAQGQASREAVEASARFNQIGVESPYGRQFYTGTLGEPDRTLNIELTPEGQRAMAAQQGITGDVAEFGQETLAPGVFERLSAGPGTAGDVFYERGMGRIAPGFERAQEQLESRLIGQGIAPGSRAWNQAQTQLAEQRDRAYTDLALGAEQFGFGEDRAQRSQSINELAALLRGAPAIGQPATTSPGQYGVQPPDIAGLTAANYAGRMNQYNTQAGQLGGLYNLGGTLGAAALMAPVGTFSDERMKENIRKVGTLDDGLPVYAFRYKVGGNTQLGLMAQDVEKAKPEAVSTHTSGYKMVDYDKAVQ